ncbi:MAG: DMT family transporter [Rhodocyclaceae bacterium]|nr:DMT family transporter [Rhodocyclaceae bacterium]
MDQRLALDGRAAGMMVLLCFLWGLQQVVLKGTADDVPPVLMLALRSGIAAVLVGLLMWVRREGWAPGCSRAGAVVGALFAVEFLLVGEALRHTSAAHTVVLLYTAPIFAAMGLHWKLPAERLSGVQWLGIGLAFGGVAVTFLGRAGDTADTFLGDAMAVLAGVAWGATTVAVRVSRLSQAPVSQTLLYQLAAAFVLLTAAALVSGQASFNPTPRAWSSLAFHALIVSFASFLAWFWLLRTYLASRLGVFSFLTPLFGVGLGALLLGETIEPGFALGTALVVAGIAVVSAHGWIAVMLARYQTRRLPDQA